MKKYVNSSLTHHPVATMIPSENDLYAWFFFQDCSFKTILYFPGNTGFIHDRVHKLNTFSELSFNYLIISYRGFQKNKGNPTESGLYIDAISSIAWLNRQGIATIDIILYGESLGAAVAVEMATRYEFAGIILESAFTSMKDMARRKFPIFPSFLVQDEFDNEKKMKDIKSPILFLHGAQDKITPVSMGEQLFSVSNPPKFKYISNDGHRMTFSPKLKEKIVSFLKMS